MNTSIIRLKTRVTGTNTDTNFTAEQSALNRHTVQPFTESEDNRCCDNKIFPSEDWHGNARNLSRIIM